MPSFTVPTNATIHAARSFLGMGNRFRAGNERGTLVLHPKWMFLEPLALVMISAWGAWCRREGYTLQVRNLTKSGNYAARMRLFQALGIEHEAGMAEHEEAGRFLPVRNIRSQADIRQVRADVSALLHLGPDTESLAAVQYCLSELLRNVLEHSGSQEGAFVCAQNYPDGDPPRVSIAVADCGRGIRDHLTQTYGRRVSDDSTALRLAMQPGVSGARPRPYGARDNAGLGLFFTRCIAKGTGGYFLIYSGKAAYRLLRARTDEEMTELNRDPWEDRSNRWTFSSPWHGTAVSVEIRTEKIPIFDTFFGWIRKTIPPRVSVAEEIVFT